MRQWLSDIWNLTRIFDKYIPRIKKLMETVDCQQRQIEDLRQNIIDMKKCIQTLKVESEGILHETTHATERAEKPKIGSESRITKVNRYYDPQMGVEYFDFEINGDKASPEDDTVAEK